MVNPEDAVIVNALVRQALVSAQEVMGENGLNAVFCNVGSVGEPVRWATGAEYGIVETHCIAKGDKYCRFEIGEVKV